jgi:hypothetical protein
MYEITFTNAHLENRVIDCNYRVEMHTIPAKGSTLTLDQTHYRVGDAHWDIGYCPFERGTSITVKVELYPTFLSP